MNDFISRKEAIDELYDAKSQLEPEDDYDYGFDAGITLPINRIFNCSPKKITDEIPIGVAIAFNEDGTWSRINV